jgi:hypothetical protein
MIKNRVSPLQRAYRLGYLTGFKRGLNRARAEFWSETERWEGRLRELEDGYAEFVASSGASRPSGTQLSNGRRS